MNSKIHDFVAIGIGPFNLGLACLTQPLDGLDGVFLDQADGFDWHPGMLLENATLQTPFLADLVTLADPTSRFSFLNYLKQSGRIYAFYIREDFFMLRQEYNQYCQWVCAQLENLRWQRRVERVEYDEINHLYQVYCHNLASGEAELYRGRHLVLGTGTVPLWPECCQSVQQQASHSASYLADKAALQRQPSITIVGSGQSAAEIYYDLLQDIDRYGYQLNWLTRSPRFFPLEYTKLTLELTSPEYVDYFHRLSLPQRDQLLQQQKGLFKGINASLINDIHELLYRKHLNGTPNTLLLANTALTACRHDKASGRFVLSLQQQEQQQDFQLETAALVLATGYGYRQPDFLAPIAGRIQRDARGRFAVARDYSIDADHRLFVQNAELHTHGLSSPDLGMACYRNARLIRSMTGVAHYPVEQRIAFQQFTVPQSQPAPERMSA
ncbi:lysine N(6)-hydroxylase/L-ornithine N(5)-oxygenase family protein [Aquitalea sp. LB_tupeE]|uniref:lysine N(6)-hydroxylase/L-ornithine N(5)-oxygenase family protein n=1 Tax=Aquitalea sp. LB_tupeE TaxID=2748078 RepID=UPI0015BDA865|nr:SidA/IucD/PvdA family monooxygenase [Aquitalea sp. LB_tupeE]NWK78914.1 SidA/IucD/PvdA family monooxygenase [Aquitalea sp. LB_tupeE]